MFLVHLLVLFNSDKIPGLFPLSCLLSKLLAASSKATSPRADLMKPQTDSFRIFVS